MVQLKALIRAVLGASPGRRDVEQYVGYCHRMALAYVRSRARAGRLNPELVPADLDRFSLDLIADLFARDSEGTFVVLRRYYEREGWEQAGEQRLVTATRRLVFSQVHDALFEHFNARDPSLAKLLRSLKRALKGVPALTLRRAGPQRWIWLSGAPDTDRRPVMPADLLERRLVEWMHDDVELKPLLGRLAELFHEQQRYRPAYLLTSLALSIRTVGTMLTVADPAAPYAGHRPRAPLFREDEIVRAVAAASQQIRTRLHDSYVGGKMDAPTYAAYFAAVEDVLKAQYTRRPDSHLPRRHFLSIHIGPTSNDEYKENHSGILDYFIRLTREEVIRTLQAEP